MIDWPPRIKGPTPRLVYDTCFRRFGSDRHGAARSRAVTAIYIVEVHHDGLLNRIGVWDDAMIQLGGKKQAWSHAYYRNRNRKWVRYLAFSILNELIRECR